MAQDGAGADSIHVLAVGSLGRAITAHLKKLCEHVDETSVKDDTLPLPDLWPASRAIVVASWRPCPALCELVEDLSYKWKRPFIPVFADAVVLRLGPVVVPGEGACWSCGAERSKQHSDWYNAELALLEHYASRPDAGPQGFLEPFAAMAAARIAQVLDDLGSSRAAGGFVWQINMITRQITTSRVVGIHGCPRCGLGRPAATRSFESMQNELAHLWAAETGAGQ